MNRPVRVVRLLVYTYANAERMVTDMSHWGLAANGSYSPTHDLEVRSATLPPELLDPEPPEVERKAERVKLIIAEAKGLLDALDLNDHDDMHRRDFLQAAIAAYEAAT